MEMVVIDECIAHLALEIAIEPEVRYYEIDYVQEPYKDGEDKPPIVWPPECEEWYQTEYQTDKENLLKLVARRYLYLAQFLGYMDTAALDSIKPIEAIPDKPEIGPRELVVALVLPASCHGRLIEIGPKLLEEMTGKLLGAKRGINTEFGSIMK